MQTGRDDGELKPVPRDGGGRGAPAEARPWPRVSRIATPCHDAYLRALRPLRLDGFIMDRAARPWSATRCQLETVTLGHGVDGAPWAATGAVGEETVVVVLSGDRDAPLRVDGHVLSQDVACALGPGAGATLVARRPGDWYMIALPAARAADLAGARAPGPAGGVVPFRVRPEALSRLRALAERTISGVEGAAPGEPSREVAAAHERELLAALGASLAAAAAGAPHVGSARVSRHEVLEKVERLLEARSSEPVYVADLCAATGLPERTLRYVVGAQYGTSPIRLLRNRRLCQLRRALLAGTEPAENLSHLAGRHGFWHMGTLAADYRRLFGELPSETRRAVSEGPARTGGTRAATLVRHRPGRGEEMPAAVAEAATGR